MAVPPPAPALIALGDPLVDAVVRLGAAPLATVGIADAEAGGSHPVSREAAHALLEAAEAAGAAVVETPGGSAANVARGVAALVRASAAGAGAGEDAPTPSVAFVGKVGNDARGEAYAAALSAAGVRPLLARAPETPTGVCTAVVDATGQRTMRPFLGAAAEMRAGDLASAAGGAMPPRSEGSQDRAGPLVLAIEGYQLWKEGLAEAACDAARRAGARVSLDLASWELVRVRRAPLRRLLLSRAVDVLLMNEDEAHALLEDEGESRGGSGGMDAATKRAVARDALAFAVEDCGVLVASCSLGADGALVRSRGCAEPQRVAAPRVDRVVDTTGAGDSYAAALLWALFLAGGTGAAELGALGAGELATMTATAARAGCAAGAAAVGCVGAQLPNERWEEVARCAFPNHVAAKGAERGS